MPGDSRIEAGPMLAGGALLIALGAGLRLWHVASTPLWLDEAYSAYAAGHGFDFLWHVVPRYETHPPFYYALLRLWTLAFGNGLIALRAPGLIAGMATPALLAIAAGQGARLIGWQAGRRRWLILATLGLACLAIALVEMSREVRPYPLMILAYSAACALLIRLTRDADDGKPIAGVAYATYLVMLALLLWLHNLGALFGVALVAALAVAVLRASMRRSDWVWLIGGHLIVGLLYLPALMIVRDQAPTWIGSTWLRFAWTTVPERLAILYAVPGWQSLAAVMLAALAVAALAQATPGRRLAAMLVMLAAVPVALSLAISVTITPVFIMRTMTPVAAPTILLLAIGATAWRDWRKWLGLGAALMLGANMLAVDLQARAGPPPQDWYGTVDWLAERFRPGDRIFAYPNEGTLPLIYALRDRGLDYPIRAIPAPVPAFDQGGWYPTGSRGVVSLPRGRLEAIAAEPATRAVPTIWLLRLGAPTYDPGDVFLHALRRDRRAIYRWIAGPIEIVALRRRSPPAPDRNRR